MVDAGSAGRPNSTQAAAAAVDYSPRAQAGAHRSGRVSISTDAAAGHHAAPIEPDHGQGRPLPPPAINAAQAAGCNVLEGDAYIASALAELKKTATAKGKSTSTRR